MKKLVIYGTGAIAELASYYFENDSDYKIVAFTNAQHFISSSSFLGRDVIPFENIEDMFSPNEFEIFIALGYKKTNQLRRDRFLQAKMKGYHCASYISKKAITFDNNFGENCLILENNVVQPFVRVGDNVFMWSGNHIGHHSIINNHCFISSHVVISGSCQVGQCAFLGVNSAVRDNVVIGEYCVLSPGAIVMENIMDRSVVISSKSEIKVIRRDVI